MIINFSTTDLVLQIYKIYDYLEPSCHLMKRFGNFVETPSHRDKIYESRNKT